MEYQIYKLKFEGAVHFGKKSLEEGAYTFCADTLFSALCQEALKMGADTFGRLLEYAKEDLLLLSDAFPYMGSTYYLPKPMKRIETEDSRGSSVLKKAYKKLKYIPIEAFEAYLLGEYDVLHAPDPGRLGRFEMKVSASIRGEEETVPYRISTYSYHSGNGLYFIAAARTPQASALLETLLNSLSYSGIGGKRASGMGRFSFSAEEIPAELLSRLQKKGTAYMSLSISLPREEELEEALSGAQYLTVKRSGFVSSETYAEEQMRKKDLYVLQAGACFPSVFTGDVYDVSGGGAHPVYRYAKPVFMEVSA